MRKTKKKRVSVKRKREGHRNRGEINKNVEP